MNTLWNNQFEVIYQDCLELYKNGNFNYTDSYTPEQLTFLSSIGYKPRELFDFIEDYADGGDPSPSTALLVASARRDYFLSIQKGIWDKGNLITAMDLPTFGDTLEGIAYLPRIIAKARGKLKGLLDPDVMYCCGGDRRFLREHGNIHPADFLRLVWGAGVDNQKIVRYVQEAMG